mmetsp:Transcript_52953/g.105202  ORF Transcript_52953/g.105202 Transcript_52953/m.105202 type:complete len:1103 (+) Transcript_52953:70-3378(+)
MHVQIASLLPGELCETISPVTLRTAEGRESQTIVKIEVGQRLEILEMTLRRVKVKAHNVGEGWITTHTRLNEPVFVKFHSDEEEDFEAGGIHEVKSFVVMRAEESLASSVITELKPGTTVTILELGMENRSRAMISVQDVGQGWITLCTKKGEALLGKLHNGPDGGGGGIIPLGSRKDSEIFSAACHGEVEAIRKLVQRGSSIVCGGVDLNSSNIRGRTALMHASSHGHAVVVKYLLSLPKDVNVNLVDDTQKGALHHACKNVTCRHALEHDADMLEIIGMLLDAKACLEAGDHKGRTAIMFATGSNNEAVVHRLLEAQAGVNNADYQGRTPLCYALQTGNDCIAKLLREHGAEEPQLDVLCEDNNDLRSIRTTAKSLQSVRTTATSSQSIRTTTTTEISEIWFSHESVRHESVRQSCEAGTTESTNLASGQSDMSEVFVAKCTEEMENRKQALAKLDQLLLSSTSVVEIEAAIKVVRDSGASEIDVKEAVEAVMVLNALSQAARSRDVNELKHAIESALGTKVAESAVSCAQRVLKEEELKQAARDRLKAAKDDGQASVLKLALEAGKQAGLDSSDLLEFEEVLVRAEVKEKAHAFLEAAIKDKNVSMLKDAIQQAWDAGLDRAVTQDAEATLGQEESKQGAIRQLVEACENASIAGLKAAIDAARLAGLDAEEILDANAMLAAEEEKERLLDQVNLVLAEVQDVAADIDALRAAKDKLSMAIDAALHASVPEAALVTADIRRKKLHNQVEDLKGSIRVFCRIRPLSQTEVRQGDASIIEAADSMTFKVQGMSFKFDSVWVPGTQDEVFDDCKDLVQSAIDGYNVTMFAYGQTGAGKTYTMYGSPGHEGTTPRTIMEIFRVIDLGRDRFDFVVTGSILELYRNDLVDLLHNSGDTKKKQDRSSSILVDNLTCGDTKKKLNIRQDKSGSIIVENLIEEQCSSADELMQLLERGNAQRTVAATAMNSESSRSHLVLIVKVVSVNKVTGARRQGKIITVDLAGSERLKKSQVEAHMQREAIEINKSLSALGDVIEALTKGSSSIPYRNHKLTQLMQDSLGGTAKTLMFVNCSPAASNMDETLNSLKYASRAKQITNQVRQTQRN